jgi:hypothetical protein
MSLWRAFDGLDLRNVHLGDSQLRAWQYKKNAVASRREKGGGDPTPAFNRFWRFWVLMSPLSMPHADTGRIELAGEHHSLVWVRLEPDTRGFRWLRVEQLDAVGPWYTRYRLVCQCRWTIEEREWSGMATGVLYAYEQHLAWHREDPD